VRTAILLAAVGCSGSSAPPANVAAEGTVRVGAGEPVGWLALAPAPGDRNASWLPTVDAAAAVPWSDGIEPGLATGATFDAIASAGAIGHVTARSAIKVSYGCDDNKLDVVPLDGPRFAPGPVWVLPAGGAAAWRPAPVHIVPTRATSKQRVYTIGPIAITLTAIDDRSGVAQVSRDGITLTTFDIARGEMDGDEGTFDLAGAAPSLGVPSPIGAWQLGGGVAAPFLIAVTTPSHEGFHLSAYLVEMRAIREVEAMSRYLYSCAF
jgi:hypothetical protein